MPTAKQSPNTSTSTSKSGSPASNTKMWNPRTTTQNKQYEKRLSSEKSSEHSAPHTESQPTKHSHRSSQHGKASKKTSDKNSTECSPLNYAELNKYKIFIRLINRFTGMLHEQLILD